VPGGARCPVFIPLAGLIALGIIAGMWCVASGTRWVAVGTAEGFIYRGSTEARRGQDHHVTTQPGHDLIVLM
jgi:hypothetical protein